MNAFPIIEKARAKINLTLHVGPLSADGYHPLQSLVVFADIGDVVEMRPAKGSKTSLTIEGPFADGLESDDTNLILKTAQFLSEKKFDFKLSKNLPIASGIGGGSADAAATARLIERESAEQIIHSLVEIGADIPVCVASETCVMEGKGERLYALPQLGEIYAVLVNPGVAISTGKVFKTFDVTKPDSSNLSEQYPIHSSLLDMALAGRNDLQDAAISIAPAISTVLEMLNEQDACLLARMSGSGATCFGLFSSQDTARAAQNNINTSNPDWWCVQVVLGDQA